MSSWPAVSVRLSSNAPGGLELVHRAGAGAHVLGLVHRALHRHADVGHLLAHAGRGLGDLDLRLGSRVLGLDDLLLGAELLELGAQLLLLVDQPLLLLLELDDLLVERLQLGLGELLALERRAREILTPRGQRLARLGVELDDLLLELLLLELQPLLRCDDVGDALLDVLEQLHLLGIGVLERLGRILRLVEHLVDLRLDDGGHASAHSGHGYLRVGVLPQAYPARPGGRGGLRTRRGGASRSPAGERGIGRQRGPLSNAEAAKPCVRLMPATLVSSRRPAIIAYAWPGFVKTVIQSPLPPRPQRMNEPESSGALSRPAACSANETVPEQSAPLATSNSRLCPPP